jgi:hypothetical protein
MRAGVAEWVHAQVLNIMSRAASTPCILANQSLLDSAETCACQMYL